MNPKYLYDSYLKEFNAKVVEVDTDAKAFVASDTIFYPLSGGQLNDLGVVVVNGQEIKVVDVRKKDGKIWHFVEKIDAIKPNEEILMKIDWERRYSMMRMHTAAHLISSLIYKKTGAKITGNQLGLDKSRIDFNLENFDRELIFSIEPEANELIEKGIEVKSYFLPRDEAFKIPELIKLKDVLPPNIPELRIVEIVGVDIQACGGTHVKNLKEIGKIKILKAENKGKNNRRLYYTIV